MVSVTGSYSKVIAPIRNGDADAASDRKRAREQESDRSSSGSEDEEDGAAPGGRQQLASNTRKRRKNVLPVIKRNQRCGHCQTCLNPRVGALHAFGYASLVEQKHRLQLQPMRAVLAAHAAPLPAQAALWHCQTCGCLRVISAPQLACALIQQYNHRADL